MSQNVKTLITKLNPVCKKVRAQFRNFPIPGESHIKTQHYLFKLLAVHDTVT